MTKNELIQKLQSLDIDDCDVTINFSYKNNGSYHSEIKSINVECDNETIFINIGELNDLIDNKEINDILE